MVDTLLPRGETYQDVYGRFRWAIPPVYNIAVDVCDRHAAASRCAPSARSSSSVSI